MQKSCERFSNKVANYVKFRPSYPPQLVQTLIDQLKLTPASCIADIGSGTGIFSRLLLEHYLSVIAIEPNREMLAAAKDDLSSFADFTYRNSSAAQTGLTSNSIDLITVAQAFHWFHNNDTQREFKRVLKDTGHLALIWNKRDLDCEFQEQYHQLLTQFCEEYQSVNHMNLSDQMLQQFYAPNPLQTFNFHYSQQLSFVALLGRLQSTSYCPASHTAQYSALAAALKVLFNQYAKDDVITFNYISRLYLGRLNV